VPGFGVTGAGLAAAAGSSSEGSVWAIGRDSAGWDRQDGLTAPELRALTEIGPAGLRRSRARGARRSASWQAVGRLSGPLDQAAAVLHHDRSDVHRRAAAHAAGIILQHCCDSGRAYWAWTGWDWARLAGPGSTEFLDSQALPTEKAVRPFLVAVAYLLAGFTEFQHLGMFNRLHLAHLVFGPETVDAAASDAAAVLDRWGYRSQARDGVHQLPGVLAQAFLVNGSPRLQDLSTTAFARLQAHPANGGQPYQTALYALQKVVADLGHCDAPVRPGGNHMPVIEGAGAGWTWWVERWHATSPLTPKVRAIIRTIIAKAGRWLAAEHPEITEPGQWTRQTCAAWVAAIDRMAVGDYVQRRDALGDRAGQPIAPRTKAHFLMASRTFFRDCQEWEWFPRRFDPTRALAVPRSVSALIGTDPRVIADDVWAKLLHAGLNIETADLPGTSAGSYYPMALVRALTLTWLFSGLRSDEISRLRVGCIRWQHDGLPIPADSRQILAADAVCLLDVPVSKTATAFTKPVDPIIGQAIEAWQALRPGQPQRLDRKTSEHVDLLFCIRAHPVAKNYINRTIIPALCRKAGVPAADVRGNITSHRARSTIASQLYNAKEPMTLFELQAWLGHRTPVTTQHYAKITPNTLTKAYTEAGYFARNLRTIEVLLDRDAVTGGGVAAGEPWQYHDLGHGLCSYTFFEQCPHRMACAKCDFYTPKDSTKAQLIEAKGNLQRMLASIPLTDDERAAVDDGQTALEALLGRLADVPTPAGATPRQIGIPPAVTLLPIIEVHHGKQG
jgi:integrase